MMSDTNRLLGDIVKAGLQKQSLSMRKLSELTGIDTATISRIVNGKQKANLNHLQKFAECLSIPLEKLVTAAGYKIKQEKSSLVDTINEILAIPYLPDGLFISDNIKNELSKYEQFANTEEGRQLIEREFQTKINEVKSIGPIIDKLKNIYQNYCQDNISSEMRSLYGSALLYFIISTDVIPDYFFPIGYIDDTIAVQLVLDRIAELTKHEK